MKKSNAEILVLGLRERGYIVHAASVHIMRWHGQPMMNKAAGEAAPIWALRANPAWKFEKVIRNGDNPTLTFPDGQQRTVEVCSHIPLTHILKYPADDWEINLGDDSTYYPRLTIDTPDLPASW